MKSITFTDTELNIIMESLNDFIDAQMSIETEKGGATIKGSAAYNAFIKIENSHAYEPE